MKNIECCREQDVLDALTSGRWPGRADEHLRAHVAACAICADLVEVAGALLALGSEQADDATGARIPSSAVMWWRAQMRARQEAAREAARPITVAQVVASVTAIAVTVTAFGALSPWFREYFTGFFPGETSSVAVTQGASVLLAYGWMLPALIIGVWLVLAPVAIYFAVADD